VSDERPPARADDAVLATRVAGGDQAAFAAVYDRHADVLYGSVARFLRDRQAAEEVVQDAFVAFWRQAGTYESSAGTLVGWLLRIARNKAIDRARSIARRPHLVDPAGGDADVTDALERAMATGSLVGGGSDRDAQPDQVVAREWSRAVVRTALTAMPQAERRPLELAYDEGLTQAEVAARLGWPLGTVKTRTRRGLAALRDVLEGVPDLTDDVDRGPGVPDRTAERGGGHGPR
jgi:RNA polymerase sigma-70 factor (ECF subfamily)